MNISGQLVQDLKGSFDFTAERKRETIYFHMDTQYIHMGLNGKRNGTETYILKLRCIPDTPPGKHEDQYTCSEFTMQVNDGPAVTIPALKNWTYGFNPTLSGRDSRGPMWGIPRTTFENVIDSAGNALHFSLRYALYNNFIDFHSINDVFARPMGFGKGIQDLKNIGQKIVHAAAFIEARVDFVNEFKPGSVFRNGEVTLELKGVGLVDGSPCAIVGYNSGESALKMIMALEHGQESVTEGCSQYMGDIYVDIETRWVRKASLDEYLVTQIRLPDSPTPLDGYTVRHILLRSIGSDEFERKLTIHSPT
jgi:hypothetical protein